MDIFITTGGIYLVYRNNMNRTKKNTLNLLGMILNFYQKLSSLSDDSLFKKFPDRRINLKAPLHFRGNPASKLT